MIDATCAPADIAYPQDINLLNDACKKLEKMIDELHNPAEGKKPRKETSISYTNCINHHEP